MWKTAKTWMVATVLFLAAGAVLTPLAGQASEPTANTVLRLAQMAVVEVSLGPDTPRKKDWAAMMHVIGRRSEKRGVPVAEMVCRYSAGWKDDCSWRKAAGRTYIAQLTLDGRVPPSWPKTASWERHRSWWLEAVAMARAFTEGRLRDPCTGKKPWHFGAPYDRPDKADQRICRFPGQRQYYWD